MRFEKLNNDKIRITLDLTDLQEKHIDYHSFMSNSVDTQKLFLDMLEEAEEKIGFETKDYKIAIEAIANIDGNFVITITRTLPEEGIKNRPIKAKRKTVTLDQTLAIYSFSHFDDFCHFCNFISSCRLQKIERIARKITLYCYQDTYYLLLEEMGLKQEDLKYFYSTISEFGKFVHHSDLFKSKLMEYGNLIMKHNAIKTCSKHFLNPLY